MSDDNISREAEAEELSANLRRGLKACRAMVDDYRMILRGESNDNMPIAQATAELIEPASARHASNDLGRSATDAQA